MSRIDTTLRMPVIRPGLSLAALLCTLSLLAGEVAAAAIKEPQLHRLRAERRQMQLVGQQDPTKSGEPLLFGLLVIPVDFADTRLPEDWQAAQHLTPRLTGTTGETLENYFRIASREKLELRVTLAPLIHLEGSRLDYTDPAPWIYIRSRLLASEAIAAVAGTGMEFRRLDMEGPDRIAGTADDDGQVDGVLIVHAGIGRENDLVEGLIPPLQYYLDEPVVSGGIEAAFYATVSMHSGPGIWAHETAHLLGLEDRYDPLHTPEGDSEILNAGGLGRFSLMASGAWGTGGGHGAALPDGYSCRQMGWYDLHDLPAFPTGADTLAAAPVSGQVARIWTHGRPQQEFFLLESRDPAATAPFDAAVPAGQLLVYHVDETIPEGGYEVDGPDQWHLRVHLVEADGDRGLRDGLNDGSLADLFPGSEGVTRFGPDTWPASDGYESPSQVDISMINSLADAVSFRAQAALAPSLSFTTDFSGTPPVRMTIVVREDGTPLSSLQTDVAIVGPATWGTFAGGALTATVAMEQTQVGLWQPFEPIVWVPAEELVPGAQTTFRYTFTAPEGMRQEVRTWIWRHDDRVLSFAGDDPNVWPGAWVIDHPDNDPSTTWHRWQGVPWSIDSGAAVLACTDEDFAEPTDWPAVTYGNGAHTTLTSGELGPEVRAVRLVHALAVEHLTRHEVMDGALVVWVGPDDNERAAVPVDGWPGKIADGAANPRQGAGCFTYPALDLVSLVPLWRTDILAAPDDPGPWRLRLVFASNGRWRREGWFIADIEPLLESPPLSALPLAVTADNAGRTTAISWQWPWLQPATASFVLERALPAADITEEPTWQEVWAGQPTSSGLQAYSVAWSELSGLPAGDALRHTLRLTGPTAWGELQSRPLTAYVDGGDGDTVTLSQPWPNPAFGEVRMLLDVGEGLVGELSVYDVRGRRVRKSTYPGGEHLVIWAGDNDAGARLASGAYFLKLTVGGASTLRKVVLLN